jgi:hypothetical protein
MKDLSQEKVRLAEEYRAELSEQFSELIPHFPNVGELERAKRVLTAIVEAKLHKENEEVFKIFNLSGHFSVFDGDDDEIVWLGHDTSFLDSHNCCLNRNGKIGSIIKISDDTGTAPPEEFIDITKNDSSVLEYVPRFIFTNSEELEKTIDGWYEARKLINKYAYKLGVV